MKFCYVRPDTTLGVAEVGSLPIALLNWKVSANVVGIVLLLLLLVLVVVVAVMGVVILIALVVVVGVVLLVVAVAVEVAVLTDSDETVKYGYWALMT
jgi:hypothetical protein